MPNRFSLNALLYLGVILTFLIFFYIQAPISYLIVATNFLAGILSSFIIHHKMSTWLLKLLNVVVLFPLFCLLSTFVFTFSLDLLEVGILYDHTFKAEIPYRFFCFIYLFIWTGINYVVEGPSSKAKAKQMHIVETANDLLFQLSARIQTAFYVYPADWEKLNKDVGCDVCAEFGVCASKLSKIYFFEVDAAQVLSRSSVQELGRLEELQIQLDEPGVYVFKHYELQHFIPKPDLLDLQANLTRAVHATNLG